MAFPINPYESCDAIFYCFAVWLNTITYGAFWTIIAASLVITLFLASIRYGVNRAFGFSSVVGLLLATYLLTLKLMPYWVGTIFVLAGCIGVVAMLLNER